MTLDKWLQDEGRTGRWLAAELGCSQKRVSDLRRGRGAPGPILAKSIERVTDGKVTQWKEKNDE